MAPLMCETAYPREDMKGLS